MHVHPSAVCQDAINTYGLGNEERAVAAEGAAQLRKRLRQAAQTAELDTLSDPEARLMIGQWLDSRPGPALPGNEYHASEEGKDLDPV